ncbi:unannotated protein [freshwater metagenome]|uniref:Unannotated protein n=1 Tax=freshwater metagenome TaxID=449393 RepID=A0A6J6PUP5_9ZZZZ
MANNDESASIGPHVVQQPVPGICVKVVGGLVEQE